MAREIRIPELGENVEEAEVLAVLVNEGDEIKAEQPILELETDKASFEMPSPAAGVVKAVRVSVGDSVEIGQVVLELEAEEREGPREEPQEARREDEPEGAREQEPSEEASEEAPEAADEAGEADREDRRPQAARAPRARERAHPEEREAERPAPDAAARRRRGAAPLPAAPSVRRLARELGIALEQVEGTGPEGRISSQDVTHLARGMIREALARRRRPAGAGLPQLPDFTRFGEIERRPLSGIRRRTAENMTRSWVSIPHVTQHDRADVTGLERERRRLAPRVEAEGARLTPTAIAVKVAASALRVFPKLNASIDVENDEAIFKRYVHVGVAVDTEWGLLAPVIRDADRKSLLEIAAELGTLSERARRRKARPEDLNGASFTVTNLGGLGTTTFAPLVRWPEVAVLGVGRLDEELRPGRDGPEPRLMLPLSISYDHRWIDGADAARFLRWVAEALESPLLLALGR